MSSARRLPVTALVLLTIGIVGTAGALLALRGRAPAPFVHAAGMPQEPVQRDGAWYWMERPSKGMARLIRATRAGEETIAAADEIAGFDTDGREVAWTARSGRQWSVWLAASDGKGRAVRTTKASVGRPALAGGRALWVETGTTPLPNAIPLPALEPTSRLLAAGTDRRAITLGDLPEARGQVLGTHAGDVYIACVRDEEPPVTVFYTIPLAGGPARRLAGQDGSATSLLRSDGTLLWLAPSQDSSDRSTVACIRSRGQDGRLATECDWLPMPGQLFVAGDTAYFVSTISRPAVWWARRPGDLPAYLTLPHEYLPIAVGDRDVLIRLVAGSHAGMDLFTVPRP